MSFPKQASYNFFKYRDKKNILGPIVAVRFYSEEKLKSQRKISKYKHTMNLPASNFLRSQKRVKRRTHEKKMRKTFDFSSMYDVQASRDTMKTFLLHDGPPYANGDLHMGHALNKILKDITVRYKYLEGYKVDFLPGWDCHGLPIEMKAVEEAQKKGQRASDWEQLSPLEIRAQAQNLAQSTIRKQKKTFSDWSLFVNWSKSYNTAQFSYIAREMEIFGKLHQKGLIFQGYMPVHFSPSSRSCLAASELEYKHDHISPSLYLALPIHCQSKNLFDSLTSLPVYLSIWTTTPWSLPSNVAVCVNSTKDYLVVATEVGGRRIAVLWMKDRMGEFGAVFRGPTEVIATIPGCDLVGGTYVHPVYGHQCPIVHSENATNEKGTGLVHMAPSHGREDFFVALKSDLPLNIQLIDDRGLFKAEAGNQLAGKCVLSEGNQSVISSIKNNSYGSFVLHLGEIQHSYPYDWRTKKPIIIRASNQWFFDVEKIKTQAVAALDDVIIHPERLRKPLVDQIVSRPYWCLSRQRAWGVPIPAFYDQHANPVIDMDIVGHVSRLVESRGPDVWWQLPEDQLLPPEFVEKRRRQGLPLPTKGSDTLDVWFDSGCSWFCALDGRRSDVCLEGLDQINGWFQSSLLTCVALTDRAPYKELVLHEMTVDKNFRKMSKSLGNVVDPVVITDGGSNLQKDPVYGVNVLRWWAASNYSTALQRIVIGEKILQETNQIVGGIQASIWFLLANLKDFSPQRCVPYDQLRTSDKFLLHQIQPFINKVREKFNSYDFGGVTFKVEDFIRDKLNTDYMGVNTTILQCSAEDSLDRRSVQTTLFLSLPFVVASFAPILPLIAEEAALHSPIPDWKVFESELLAREPPEHWHTSDIGESLAVVKRLRKLMKNQVLESGKNFCSASKPYSLLDPEHLKLISIRVRHSSHVKPILRSLQTKNSDCFSELCFFLGVSEVCLEEDSAMIGDFVVDVERTANDFCHRCWMYKAKGSELCALCHSAIETITTETVVL